jgi:anti-sigma factor RsiW
MAEKTHLHEERLEQLMAYYGGDLTGDELAEFEAHLAGCEDCQITLKLAKKTLPMAEAMLAFKPKHTIDEQVARFEAMWAEKRRAEARARTSRNRRWLVVAFGATAAAATAVAILRFGPNLFLPGEVYGPERPAAKLDAGRPDAGADGGANDGG